MADDVGKIKDDGVEINVSDGVNSLDIELKSTRNDSRDNSEELASNFEGDVGKKDSCGEEKQTKTSENDVAILFENVQEKNDELLFQDLGIPAEENNPSVELTAGDSELEKEENIEEKDVEIKDDSLKGVSSLHDVAESEENSTHPAVDLHLKGTEFRHRNVTEKIANIEEIPTDQMRRDSEHVQEDNSMADNTSRTEQTKKEVVFNEAENEEVKDAGKQVSPKKMSVFKYFMAEISRGYVLELDEDKYADKRRKVYTFMKIPRQVEKLMIFGFMLCLDCFLFMFTFLPVRVLVALWKLLSGLFCCKKTRLLEPAQICDVLKASIIVVVFILLEYVDFSVLYHTVRGQSVIKLYVIYNMLEVADRLFSSFGQDILDALFWTATEPRDRKREHVGTLPHFALVSSEYFVDWIKHAFITKFNDIPPEVYTEYRSRLAKDATYSRQQNAHADHFDLVSRRMGFIPLPLGSLIVRVIKHSIHIHGAGGVVLVITAYFFLLTLKILNSIIFLGKASEYAKEYPANETTTKANSTSATSSKIHTNTAHDKPGSSTETATQQDQKNTNQKTGKKTLAEIDRYTLCSKEIVLF